MPKRITWGGYEVEKQPWALYHTTRWRRGQWAVSCDWMWFIPRNLLTGKADLAICIYSYVLCPCEKECGCIISINKMAVAGKVDFPRLIHTCNKCHAIIHQRFTRQDFLSICLPIHTAHLTRPFLTYLGHVKQKSLARKTRNFTVISYHKLQK